MPSSFSSAPERTPPRFSSKGGSLTGIRNAIGPIGPSNPAGNRQRQNQRGSASLDSHGTPK